MQDEHEMVSLSRKAGNTPSTTHWQGPLLNNPGPAEPPTHPKQYTIYKRIIIIIIVIIIMIMLGIGMRGMGG